MQNPKAGAHKAFDPKWPFPTIYAPDRYYMFPSLIKKAQKDSRADGDMNLCMNIVWILTGILFMADFH